MRSSSNREAAAAAAAARPPELLLSLLHEGDTWSAAAEERHSRPSLQVTASSLLLLQHLVSPQVYAAARGVSSCSTDCSSSSRQQYGGLCLIWNSSWVIPSPKHVHAGETAAAEACQSASELPIHLRAEEPSKAVACEEMELLGLPDVSAAERPALECACSHEPPQDSSQQTPKPQYNSPRTDRPLRCIDSSGPTPVSLRARV